MNIPNKKTQEAIAELKNGKVTTFKTVEELMKDLEAPEEGCSEYLADYYEQVGK
jgi:hypothetical protein